mmetsp:Transcript_3560/g.5469  ORF Transcript_3560/g.5469 Transcript_3560/m.5469 type:complete len:466 (-) Transcript_3560:288-1685(-)
MIDGDDVDYGIEFGVKKGKITWEDVESAVFPLDHYDGRLIRRFRSLFDQKTPCHVLLALASLIGKHGKIPVNLLTSRRNTHADILRTVATYLVDDNSRITRGIKLECVHLLMTGVLPLPEDRTEDMDVVEDTLEYLLGKDFGWNKPVHGELGMFQQLRGACLFISQENKRRAFSARERKRETAEQVVRGSEQATMIISTAAHTVEAGLELSVPVISAGLDLTGNLVKKMTHADTSPRTKQGVVASVYVEKAKETTDVIRRSARSTLLGVRSASAKGVSTIAHKCEERQVGQRLVPDDDHRAVLLAAGKVGIASLGATAIVAEAMFDSSTKIAEKTASVTASVIRHTHGESAGQIVQNVSDATFNLVRASESVNGLDGQKITKAVAKKTGKEHVKEEYKALTSSNHSSPKESTAGANALDSIRSINQDQMLWLTKSNSKNPDAWFVDKRQEEKELEQFKWLGEQAT